MSTTIEDRVILLLRDLTSESELNRKPVELPEGVPSWIGYDARGIGGHGFWERFGEYTGIGSRRWRMVYGRKQRITSDMVEALARFCPEYAFWLVTGITDAVNGHIAPTNAQTFPERSLPQSSYTDEYFRLQIALFKQVFEASPVNLEDEKERMNAAERTKPLAHWWDSHYLSDAAYLLAASEDYEHLKDIAKARENARARRLEDIQHAAENPSEPAAVANVPGITATDQLPEKIPGIDPRTRHQKQWEIFYRPKDETK
jgi:hypothetical protein